MKKLIAVFFTCIVLAACGGGGSDAPALTPISADAKGTYSLAQSTTSMTNVATSETLYSNSTPTTVPPMTGVMKIGTTTFSKNLVLTDGSPLNIDGTLAFTATASNSGTFIIRNPAGTVSKSGTYSHVDPNDLTLFYGQETTTLTGAYAGTWTNTTNEKWRKTSNSF